MKTKSPFGRYHPWEQQSQLKLSAELVQKAGACRLCSPSYLQN